MSPMTTPLVSQQPTAAIMDPSGRHITEKPAHGCQNYRRCHSSHLRRLILPSAFALFVLITGLFALICLHDGVWGFEDLLQRDTGTSPLVKNKLYLIIIFVGIVVVILLGIALSFWCCQGAFKNPLCCPCYLCACCGGLACLECIGCGLCAEAVGEAV